MRAIHRVAARPARGLRPRRRPRAVLRGVRDDGGPTTRSSPAWTTPAPSASSPSAGTWLLRPRPSTVEAAGHDLDSSRLDVALAALPEHDLKFQHGWDLVTDFVAKGEADAAVLLRPATVEQIAAISHGGERMPPKTTFFYPKPATGLVFRSLDLD